MSSSNFGLFYDFSVRDVKRVFTFSGFLAARSVTIRLWSDMSLSTIPTLDIILTSLGLKQVKVCDNIFELERSPTDLDHALHKYSWTILYASRKVDPDEYQTLQ